MEQNLTEQDIKKLCERGEYETCRDLAKQAFRDAVEQGNRSPLLDLKRLCSGTLEHKGYSYKTVAAKQFNKDMVQTLEDLCELFNDVNKSERTSFPQNKKIIEAAARYIDKYMVKPTV